MPGPLLGTVVSARSPQDLQRVLLGRLRKHQQPGGRRVGCSVPGSTEGGTGTEVGSVRHANRDSMFLDWLGSGTSKPSRCPQYEKLAGSGG